MYLASPVLGESIVPPPATLSIPALIVSFICTIVLSIAFTVIVSYILHRGGLIVGIVGGGLFGLALYFIHFNTLTITDSMALCIKRPDDDVKPYYFRNSSRRALRNI